MSGGWVLLDVEGNDRSVTIDLGKLPAPDRLALARKLVADMPGVVVGRVPDEEHEIDPFVFGWNACRAAMLANGEKNDGS